MILKDNTTKLQYKHNDFQQETLNNVNTNVCMCVPYLSDHKFICSRTQRNPQIADSRCSLKTLFWQ